MFFASRIVRSNFLNFIVFVVFNLAVGTACRQVFWLHCFKFELLILLMNLVAGHLLLRQICFADLPIVVITSVSRCVCVCKCVCVCTCVRVCVTFCVNVCYQVAKILKTITYMDTDISRQWRKFRYSTPWHWPRCLRSYFLNFYCFANISQTVSDRANITIAIR